MKLRHILLYILVFSLLLISCKSRSSYGILLITQVPGNIQKADLIPGESWRHVPGAQIAVLKPDKPGSLKILTGDFYSACYPEVSYDGRFMLFSAKKKENNPWQIYEMEIKKGKARKITSSENDCIDPVYLPGGRMAFTRRTVNDTVKSAQCLYTGNINGSGITQVTFGPSADLATTVLKDGRLLTINRNLYPATGDPMLMVLRPDGTKADMFYKGSSGSMIRSRGRETDDGRLFFIEAEKGDPSEGDVISITYNRPLHSRINLTSDIGGDFNSVLPMRPGKLLVSYRKPDSDHYALYEFDISEKIPDKIVYDDPDYNVLDAVIAAKYNRPKKLPSEVNIHVKTGLLMCQDINFTGFHSSSAAPGFHKASMIEVLGVDSSYGVVPVEKDGSFYFKVLADMPFQMRTLDENGHVLHGYCSWLWLRPNERRGCVGCHEDPELVPQNRIPLAVKKQPVIIPVHITRIKEKKAELE
jgi:Hydrazine synthase alpha subunit middle domain